VYTVDDRPLDDIAATIATLRAELDDLKSTMIARAPERPTGTVDMVLRNAPAPGTLFLNGQNVSRVLYLRLWAYANEQGLVVPGLFTVGDGSTTFGLPNWQGFSPVGVKAGGDIAVLGAEVGAAVRALTLGNLPAHGHTGSASSAGTHIHDTANGFMGESGDHGGHFPGSSFNAAAGPDLGLAAWNSGGGNRGGHAHFFTLDITPGGAHTHPVTINATGDGQAFDNRPPLKACHFAIWV
jgi:microcystin-dependent protein